MYILNNGDTVTAHDIRAAFFAGRAVLVHGRAENRNTAGLMLDGKHRDTRGDCYSMWEETWTTAPASLHDAMQAAYHAN